MANSPIQGFMVDMVAAHPEASFDALAPKLTVGEIATLASIADNNYDQCYIGNRRSWMKLGLVVCDGDTKSKYDNYYLTPRGQAMMTRLLAQPVPD